MRKVVVAAQFETYHGYVAPKTKDTNTDKSISEIPPVGIWYHGTLVKYLPEILRKGLRPRVDGALKRHNMSAGPNETAGLWLVDSKAHALGYADDQVFDNGSKPALLQITVTKKEKMNIGMMKSCNRFDEEYNIIGGELILKTAIPPNQIKVLVPVGYTPKENDITWTNLELREINKKLPTGTKIKISGKRVLIYIEGEYTESLPKDKFIEKYGEYCNLS
jgi:hypothetical protein